MNEDPIYSALDGNKCSGVTTFAWTDDDEPGVFAWGYRGDNCSPGCKVQQPASPGTFAGQQTQTACIPE